jgi:hypothetical protein
MGVMYQLICLNRRTLYVDGDFGIAFTSKQITLQATIPNLKSAFFKNNDQDLVTNTTGFIPLLAIKYY